MKIVIFSLHHASFYSFIYTEEVSLPRKNIKEANSTDALSFIILFLDNDKLKMYVVYMMKY